MPVNTAKVAGRRELHFDTLNEVAADAEQIATGNWEQLGNWSLGQVAHHLALSLDNTREGREFQAPWFVRLIMPFFKKSFISKTMSPGFRMPEAMKPLFLPPDNVEPQDGVAELRAAVDRFTGAKSLPARSSTLGPMSREEWINFHCRHAEMHLSFILPN